MSTVNETVTETVMQTDDLDRLRHLRELAFTRRKEILDDKLSYYTPARDEFVEEVLKENIHEKVETASAEGKLRLALRVWSSKDDTSSKTYGTAKKLTLGELSRISRHLPHDERVNHKIQEKLRPLKVYISEFRNTPDGFEKEEGVSYYGLFVDWNNKRRFNNGTHNFGVHPASASPQKFRPVNKFMQGQYKSQQGQGQGQQDTSFGGFRQGTARGGRGMGRGFSHQKRTPTF